MMPIAKVQLPDGRVGRFEVPEGTTPEQVIEFAGQMAPEKYANVPSELKQQAAAKQAEAVDIPSRVGKGIMDPIIGLAQMAYNAMPESYKELAPDFNAHLALKEKQYQQQRAGAGQEGVDWARLGGNLIPATAAAVAAPVAGTSLPGLIGEGAIYGATFGAAHPVYGAGDFWSEKAKQAGVGAVAGAAAAPVAAGVARVVSPKPNPAARELMEEGITPTPGGVMGGAIKTAEEKFTSLPIMGDLIRWGQKRGLDEFNRAAYNRALKPIGKDAAEIPVGREGIQAVKTALGKAYDDILPKMTFQADDVFIQDLSSINAMVATLPDDVVRQFDKILRTKVIGNMTSSGRMSGESLKKVESELSRLGKGYRSGSDFDKRQLGDAIHEVQSSIRRTLERSNPAQAERLSAINQGYANYAILRRAGSMAGTEGGFTPAQLASSVKAMDKSVGKGATATGTARMQDLTDAARQVLSNKYPDSGTAGRLLLDTGAIAAGLYNPAIPVGLAAGGVPYTPMVQRILSKLLEMRPPGAQQAGQVVRHLGPVAGAAASE